MSVKASITRKNEGFEKKLMAALQGLENVEGKVGWFKGLRYHGRVTSDVGPVLPISVAKVAVIQEFGEEKRNIPPRPFMRPAIAKNQKRWFNLSKNLAKKVLKQEMTPEDAMKYIVELAVGNVKASIKAVWTPALSKGTASARLRRYIGGEEVSEKTRKARSKKFEENNISTKLFKPLIDTGYMISTLSSSVEKTK